MYCRYNYCSACTRCVKYVKSTKVGVGDDGMVISIPDMSLCNHQSICICIAQPIPPELTENDKVSIDVNGELYPLITPCLNFVYADQLRAGKMYGFKFATDTLGFRYCGGWRLCKTKHKFTCIPLPTPPTRVARKSVTPKKTTEKEEK